MHIVTGGCGFIGRNMVKRLLETSSSKVLIIDNLTTGQDPKQWANIPLTYETKGVQIFGDQLFFIRDDVRGFFRNFQSYFTFLESLVSKKIILEDVFHFAAVVGGRATIENEPLMVAIDLSIDAEFFNWLSIVKPNRVLYPSSSAAYPIRLQTRADHRALKESDIQFETIQAPDMSYGWAKITGEYLARLAAKKYGLHIACIRPFSGYGPDQDLDYPIPAITQRVIQKQNPIEVWGDGTQSRDFIYIDDVITGSLKTLDQISDGSALNLGTGNRTSFLEVISILSNIAGYSPAIKYLKEKPVGVFARYCDPTQSKNILDWTPGIPLTEGLELTFNEISNKHKILPTSSNS